MFTCCVEHRKEYIQDFKFKKKVGFDALFNRQGLHILLDMRVPCRKCNKKPQYSLN